MQKKLRFKAIAFVALGISGRLQVDLTVDVASLINLI